MSTQTVGLWPAAAPLMTAVQPWTYRDSLTATELLHDLAKQLDKLTSWAEGVKTAYDVLERRIEAVEGIAVAAVKAEADKLRTEMAVMNRDLLALISEVSVSGSCYDPTDGTEHKSVSEVLERVYDRLRTAAWFVGGVEEDEMTVGAFDALDITVRQMDLDPEKVTNHATREQ